MFQHPVFVRAMKIPREGDVFEHLSFITNTTQRSPNTNLSVTLAFKDRKRVLTYRSPEQRLLNMREREDLNYTRREYFPRFVRYQMHQECICDHLDKIGIKNNESWFLLISWFSIGLWISMVLLINVLLKCLVASLSLRTTYSGYFKLFLCLDKQKTSSTYHHIPSQIFFAYIDLIDIKVSTEIATVTESTC